MRFKLVTMTLAALVTVTLIGCGGGSSTSNNNSGGSNGATSPDPGVNGTYTGTFTPSNPAFPPFQVTAIMQQAAQPPSAPVTGTATVSVNAPCLSGVTLNITGAEITNGVLSMAMIDGPPTDGSLPKINFTGDDVSNRGDADFSGTFEIPGPRGSCPEVKGTAKLAR